MQDNTSIVAGELAKGIRKIKNKLGAKQLVETYQPDSAEAIDSESETAAAQTTVATDGSTGISLLWPAGYSPPAPDEANLDENTSRDLGVEATISGIVMRSSGRECRPAVKQILLHLCDEPDVLSYRQDIVEDLLRYPALVAGFESFCLN